MLLAIGAVIAFGTPGAITQPTTPNRSSISNIDADRRTDRQIVEDALAQLGKVDVEHHHDEQEQHRDGADIDDDQDHRQKFGAQEHEQAGRVDESENEKQHRMHGIARSNHHERRGDADAGKKIKEYGVEDHGSGVSAVRRVEFD